MRYLLSLAILFSCASTALANDDGYPDVEFDVPLPEAALQDVFAGQTHRGTYNFKNRNITTFAFTELTRKDGSVRHQQGETVDTGQWTISGETICFDYDNPALLQACFKIYKRGNCYYHYQTSTQGRPRFGFTARSVLEGATPNCEPSLV